MSIMTPAGAKAAEEMGFSRIVLPREMSLDEIKEIRQSTDLELEMFVHGALCMCVSGQCYLSSVIGSRSGNRGLCAQPCRLPFTAKGDKNECALSLKDLSLIEHLSELEGIVSLKIEGRMKTALYVAAVARTYRRAIDDCMESEEKYQANRKWYREEIAKCTYRKFTTGFYFGKPGADAQIYDNSTYINEYTYLGMVEGTDEKGRAFIHQKNKFSLGDTIEIMKPEGENVQAEVISLATGEGLPVESAPHAGQALWVGLGGKAKEHDLLRVRKEAPQEGCTKA